jgi:Bacteriocin-protection, YdeI or OmpD-Associated/Domain of unknown function (DUF1905)
MFVGMAEFEATIEARPRGGIAIKLPFDPAAEWGVKERYDVSGAIKGYPVRGPLTANEGAYYLEVGPAWCRHGCVTPGERATVELGPEGPHFGTLSPDFAAGLDAEPDARRFFESVATFYRKNFVRWIEDAKRPETRAKRIAETVAALKAGKRER